MLASRLVSCSVQAVQVKKKVRICGDEISLVVCENKGIDPAQPFGKVRRHVPLPTSVSTTEAAIFSSHFFPYDLRPRY